MSGDDPRKGDFSLLVEGGDGVKDEAKEAAAAAVDALGGAGGPMNTLPANSYTISYASAIDVHPLVLLSIVDHYARVNSKTQTSKRVVGLLLGTMTKGPDGETRLDINNCFAVPFDEMPNNPDVWLLDTNFAEEMYLMYKKVYPRIKVVGWYSSGPSIAPNDLAIHNLVTERYCPAPVYSIVPPDSSVGAASSVFLGARTTGPGATHGGVPILTYVAMETKSGPNGSAMAFRNVATSLASSEAEDIGVEHLLKDLSDATVTSLTSKVEERIVAAKRLELLLGQVEEYLRDVAAGTLPPNAEVLGAVQEVLAGLPLLHRLKHQPGFVIGTNDQMLCTFVASLARSLSAMYETMSNRRKARRKLKELAEAAAEAEKKAAEVETKEGSEQAKEKDATA